MIADDRPEATDARFDTSALAMAQRFGDVVRNRLLTGRTDVRELARHAASFGRIALDEERRVLPFAHRNGEWS